MSQTATAVFHPPNTTREGQAGYFMPAEESNNLFQECHNSLTHLSQTRTARHQRSGGPRRHNQLSVALRLAIACVYEALQGRFT